MSLLLDTGAFLAVERADRDTLALLKSELVAGRVPTTHGGVVGQAWRSGRGRQARIAHLLHAITVVPLDEDLGKRTGALLANSRTADVVDAALVLLAVDGDSVLTSDTDDLAHLASCAGLELEIVRV